MSDKKGVIERPILFSTEMVKAILDGRKGQTRRVIKPQPPEGTEFFGYVTDSTENKNIGSAGWGIDLCVKHYAKPICKPGDILWVRETWANYDRYYYKASEPYMAEPIENGDIKWFKWRPSIHMPREAARLLLTVKDVRVERLQSITNGDARAEGIHPWGLETDQRTTKWCRYTQIADPGSPVGTDRGEFAARWDSIYAKRGHVWNANPWVWVVKFERKVQA
jgi:hypothetical protein